MEPKVAHDAHVAPFAGEGQSLSAYHRLRTNLQVIFQEASLQLADVQSSQQPHLRTSLRQVCIDARRSGLRAEQLLVLVKDVWSGLPAGIVRLPSVHGDERLNYVITTCVDEYYAQPAGDNETSP